MSDHDSTPAPGTDTATGTDPDATYDRSGYEDKSLGQAVKQDQELVDDLIDETDGDVGEAERRFREESAGAPAIERQEHGSGNATGTGQAAQNREDDPPA